MESLGNNVGRALVSAAIVKVLNSEPLPNTEQLKQRTHAASRFPKLSNIL